MTFPVLHHHRQSGGAEFSPTDIAGLQLWIDFSDPTTLFTDAGTTPVASDGDLIYQANDKTINGRNAVQATEGARFTYKANIKNGLSVARLDGGDYLVASAAAMTACTAFFVASVDTGTLSGDVYFDLRRTSSGNPIFHMWSSNASVFQHSVRHRNDAGSLVSLASSTTGFNAYHVWTARWSGTQIFIYADGGATAGPSAASGATTINELTIGAQYHAASNAMHGDICELLIYNVSLSDDDRGTVRDWLNAKWAVY